jgi:hypothetical protein
MTEWNDIVAWRPITKYFSKGHPVEYLDETWIHPHYTIWKCWQNDNVRIVPTYGSAGEKLIYHSYR